MAAGTRQVASGRPVPGGRPPAQRPHPASERRRQPGPAPAPVSSSLPRIFPARLDTPLTSYYLVLGPTAALIVIGLVMVLSSSSVESYADTGSAFSVFSKQALFAVLGLPLMVLASRLRTRAWTALAWPMMLFALLFQATVFTPLGLSVYGNRNWIRVAGMTMQPVEAAKLALLVWAATVLARKRQLLTRPLQALVPVVPATGLLLLVVLLGDDLGSALVLMLLVAAALFVAGVPLRVFAALGAVAGALVGLLVVTSSNRMGRLTNWGGPCTDYLGTCWQTVHGTWALASGGWWGVGLGASRQKWGLLPEAHNDFIFAIIGEELGLIGSLVVVGLFALLALGLFRVVLRSDELFVKVATAGVLTWVLGQAVVNIGAVIGLLPVIGLPLPLVSSGGSALVMTMVALGMVIGFARREAGAAEALAARAGLVQRSLAVLPVRRGAR